MDKSIIVLLFALVGCSAKVEVDSKPNTAVSDFTGHYSVVCLDGVEYWKNGWSLAPKIDKNSLLPVKCKN